ncbi:MAG: GMP/IMP nucleotidase [Gammaproteobacteria bacterium]
MLDWPRIDTVLLDMDGTLLDLRFDNWFWQELLPERWGAVRGLGLMEAQRQLKPMFEREEGTLNWYCLEHWTRTLGLDVAALKREHENEIRVHPYVIDFLDAVRGHGKRVVLVTNAHRHALDIKLGATGIGGHFDAVHSSHDYGAPKESPDFWQRLAVREPFDSDRTLFVDDSRAVLEAAREYGIAHVIAVAKPDSMRPTRTHEGFRHIHDFRELSVGL